VKSQVLAAVAAVVVAIPALIAAPTWAQSEADAARYVAGNCANCHGTTGVARGGMPSLAGQKKEQIAARVREFRDGKRASTLMHQIAKGYSDAQIDAIAEQIARQSMAPDAMPGPGRIGFSLTTPKAPSRPAAPAACHRSARAETRA